MKRLSILIATITLLAACTSEKAQTARGIARNTLTIALEENVSRIKLNGAGKSVWTIGDLVSVFYRSDANQMWRYTGQTGERSGSLEQVTTEIGAVTIPQIVAVYPYNEEYRINPDNCEIEVTTPATQNYTANSYGAEGTILVSASVEDRLLLRSASGWLKLQLRGNGEIVKSIVFRGNAGEQVAGRLYLDPTSATITTATSKGESSAVEIFTEITLDCSEGATLSDKITAMFIALPPQRFDRGFSITINGPNGEKMVKTTEHSITFERNTIQPMEAFEVRFDNENNDTASLTELFARDMVSVAGGTFLMGQTTAETTTQRISQRAASDSEDDDSPRADELPIHHVTVADFEISKYEVTQKQWVAVMGENPSYFPGNDNHPVDSVSWDEVQEFIAKLNALTGENYRLPTEAEWEFAARGGNLSKGFRYSGSDDCDQVAWYADSALEQMAAVGQKMPNELGLYDMSGNAFEWVFDWFGSYTSQAQTNPKGPSTGEYHVLRGGSWKHSSNGCRVSFRTRIPTYHLNKCGFRLAKGIDLATLPYNDNQSPQSITFSKESITVNSTILPYRKALIGNVTTTNKGALVIYLHGGSSKGSDNESQMNEPGILSIATHLATNGIGAVMVVPQCPSSMSWGGQMNRVLKGLLDSYIQEGIIDTSRIYIFGGSMGGTGAWGLISAYPRLFTAAMPVAANPSKAVVENVAPTAVYTVMGTADALMSVDTANDFITALREAGGTARIDIIEGWDHATTCTESYTTERLEWVFSHRKE